MLLAVIIPVLGAGITILYQKKSQWTAGACCIGVCSALLPVRDTVEYTLNIWMNPLPIHLSADTFTLFFGFIISFLFLMSILSSFHIKGRWYYPLLLLDLSALLLTIFSSQLLLFYVFLEISTIITYFLIIYKETQEAVRAGFKYILMNVGGALLILLAVLLDPHTGSVFFVAGCLIKAGSFPVHVWLADAHPAAPSPVSALLSGVMVKTGIYGIFRFADYFAIDFSGIVVVALASMLIGVFLALLQTDVKRILAYHTVSQVGFIFLGIGIQGKESVAGGLLHLINHGMFKALLFLCMGCVIYATGEKSIHRIRGLARKMPITAAACFVGCLSISGIPPFNGFVSKTLIFHGLDSVVLQVLFIAACAGTVASFIKLFGHTFLEWGPAQSTGKKSVPTLREIPLLMKLPLVVLSGVCLFLGVYPGYVLPFVGYTGFVWNMALAGECVLPLLCGILLYYIGLKTKVILNPPTFRITVDALFCTGGRAVEHLSTVLNKVLTQDLNYYITCLVVVLLAFLFWFYI